jgi:2-polyprenyl-3-methyl-5-hydroxy-6-metoxy-1,4-benzoquinol methylase
VDIFGVHLKAMERHSEDLYEIKDRDYFGVIKHHVISKLVSEDLGHILDVGGGDGATAKYLIRKGRCHAATIIDPYSNAINEDGLNFIRESIEAKDALEIISEVNTSFDTIMFLDVLEHLVNPWQVLANMKSMHKPNGDLIVCMPNARYMSLVVPLVLFGRFKYKESGIMDRTHIRWFTRSTTIELIEGAGYEIYKIDAYIDRRVKFLNKLTFGLFRGFFEYQYIVQAKPAH